jgi:hypothetical protein
VLSYTFPFPLQPFLEVDLRGLGQEEIEQDQRGHDREQGLEASAAAGALLRGQLVRAQAGRGSVLARDQQEQETAARRNPRPPNLETLAAALTRDEIDLSTVLEWSPFMIKDIDRGEWIDAMIANHKIAKHTANALLLYPLLESHCPRCTQIHDPYHRCFSAEKCSVLSRDGPKEGFAKCKYIYCCREPTHARRYCPKINLRCFNCLHPGHAERDNVWERH